MGVISVPVQVSVVVDNWGGVYCRACRHQRLWLRKAVSWILHKKQLLLALRTSPNRLRPRVVNTWQNDSSASGMFTVDQQVPLSAREMSKRSLTGHITPRVRGDSSQAINFTDTDNHIHNNRDNNTQTTLPSNLKPTTRECV